MFNRLIYWLLVVGYWLLVLWLIVDGACFSMIKTLEILLLECQLWLAKNAKISAKSLEIIAPALLLVRLLMKPLTPLLNIVKVSVVMKNDISL